VSGPHAIVTQTLAWLREVLPAAARRGDLQLDSRKVKQGDIFVAVPGLSHDGRSYLAAAAECGAAAALVDADGWSGAGPAGIPVRAVPQLRTMVGSLAAAFYGNPSAGLLSIGVTGTNGKTSCSHFIAQLLNGAGRRCAVIGTVGVGFVDEPLAQMALTTPDPVALQRDVRQLLDAGAQALVMEVSSIGLDQGRVNGMKYDVALYTNLTRDHLDYHGSMARYEACKALLFDWPTLSHAVLNLDDDACRRLLPRLVDRGVRVIGYGFDSERAEPSVHHRLTADSVRATAGGLVFRMSLDGESLPVEVPLVGHYNVANLLGAVGVSLACGVSFSRAASALPRLQPPPGRMQRIAQGDAPLAVVDYAHTPDALVQALAALRPLAGARGGRLWVVFGAGGDRDPGKRAPMGAAAAAAADVVVITSDNPRTEDPAGIVEQIAAGARGARELMRLVDRAAAIEHALTVAAPEDVVLIAGKGHEDYQVLGLAKRPFSDVAIARSALSHRARR
jgi:UDP-N-acetylmuramoyl-L-alanyl-D-glutamate--2,6-diaminopimelate ligase